MNAWRGRLPKPDIMRAGRLSARCALFGLAVLSMMLPGSRIAYAQSATCLSLAEAGAELFYSPEQRQRQFKLYQDAHLKFLRTRVTWRGAKPGTALTLDNADWLEDAARSGFRFRLQFATVSEPPAWFLQQTPAARIVGTDGDFSRNMISLWYPGLHELIKTRMEEEFRQMADKDLLNSVASVIVDLGPAGEPLYPPAWTRGPGHEEQFWFYGPGAAESFRRAMQAKYTDIARANQQWGTDYARWDDVEVPKPHIHPGPLWADLLDWYRDEKRSFIRWQIETTQSMLKRYSQHSMPPLVVLVPGQHLSEREWSDAVQQGNGGQSIKIMSDTDFLIDLAQHYGLQLQYTGLPNDQELSYISGAIAKTGTRIPLWGENVGSPQAIARLNDFSAESANAPLFGLELVNSSFLLDSATQSPLPIWPQFQSLAARLDPAACPL